MEWGGCRYGLYQGAAPEHVDAWLLGHGFQVIQKPLGAVVHDELVGHLGFFYQWHDFVILRYHHRYVGVASENYGHLMLLGQLEQFEVVGARHGLVAGGRQRVVVDLEQRVGLLRRQHQLLEVEQRRAVARMADDLHVGVAHGLYHARCVFLLCSSLPAQAVYAGNAQVECAQVALVEVYLSLGVENVEFRSHHQLHAIHLAWHAMHVPEIDGLARAGYAGSMLCDAEYLQSHVGCCCGHLLDGAVCVARSHGVGVYIELCLHASVFFSCKGTHYLKTEAFFLLILVSWFVATPPTSMHGLAIFVGLVDTLCHSGGARELVVDMPDGGPALGRSEQLRNNMLNILMAIVKP